jgi:hypothetical protein
MVWIGVKCHQVSFRTVIIMRYGEEPTTPVPSRNRDCDGTTRVHTRSRVSRSNACRCAGDEPQAEPHEQRSELAAVQELLSWVQAGADRQVAVWLQSMSDLATEKDRRRGGRCLQYGEGGRGLGEQGLAGRYICRVEKVAASHGAARSQLTPRSLFRRGTHERALSRPQQPYNTPPARMLPMIWAVINTTPSFISR